MKTPVLESLSLNKAAGLKICNFIKKQSPTQVFSCEYSKVFFYRRLLLYFFANKIHIC